MTATRSWIPAFAGMTTAVIASDRRERGNLLILFLVIASEAKQSQYQSGIASVASLPRNDDSLSGIASLLSQGPLRSSQ